MERGGDVQGAVHAVVYADVGGVEKACGADAWDLMVGTVSVSSVCKVGIFSLPQCRKLTESQID
jgi:hypothetical protein